MVGDGRATDITIVDGIWVMDGEVHGLTMGSMIHFGVHPGGIIPGLIVLIFMDRLTGHHITAHFTVLFIMVLMEAMIMLLFPDKPTGLRLI